MPERGKNVQECKERFKDRTQLGFSATLFSAEFGISDENISLLSPVKMTLFVLFQGPRPPRVLSQNEMNNDALFFIVPFSQEVHNALEN